jgi:plasmid stabilization system protein ParE
MHWAINWRVHPATTNARGLRSAAGFLLAALGVGVLLLLLEFNQSTRVLTDPALESLERAQSYLDQSYGLERRLLRESRTARQDLEKAVSSLAMAGKVHPSTDRTIDALRSKLETLGAGEVAGQMAPEELDTRYRSARGRIADLIDAQQERYR